MTEHRPIAPFQVIAPRPDRLHDPLLVIAACACGGDCGMTAALMPDAFFTPNGDQATRFFTP